MRFRHAIRPALAVGLLVLPALHLGAQQRPETPARTASQESASNPQLDLPYGTTSAEAVSPWTPPASAGRQLTLRDLLGWKSIRTPQLSNDGRWFAYELAPNEGDSEVIVRSTAASGQEWRFPVGSAPSGGFGTVSLGISGNNRWVAFMVRPNSEANRARPRGGANAGAGAASSAPATKLAVVNLADGSKREYENVRSYRFAGDTSSWIVIQHAPASGGGNASGSLVQLVNLAAPATTPSVPIPNVTEFAFDDAGQWMAYAIATPDKLGNSLQLRRLSNGETRALDTRKATYRRITWGDSSLALAALRVEDDTTQSVDEIVNALVWPRVTSSDAPRVVDAKTSGLPAGKVLSDDYAIAFGPGASALYVGLRDPRPAAPRAG
ncbi:MAG TPA: hypothetical protein PK788_10520, partial [Gemmatimonadaceae bacterium]|nr:hypothetical protein [Gemmatimonadaceae bacterium]